MRVYMQAQYGIMNILLSVIKVNIAMCEEITQF